jgi:hypothetical protein
MPIQAICSECDAAYTLADVFLGKKVRCKKCQAAFIVGPARSNGNDAKDPPVRGGAVPPNQSAKTPPSSQQRDARDYTDVEKRAIPARTQQVKRRILPWVLSALAAGFMLALGVAGTLVAINLKDRQSPPSESPSNQQKSLVKPTPG